MLENHISFIDSRQEVGADVSIFRSVDVKIYLFRSM